MGIGIVNPALLMTWENGERESQEYITARYTKQPVSSKRQRVAPPKLGSKKQRKEKNAKQLKEDHKQAERALKDTRHELRIANLKNKVLRKEGIAREELSGLTKKQMAEIAGKNFPKRWTWARCADELVAMAQGAGCAPSAEADDVGSGSAEDEDENLEEASHLIVRLRRTPSGNHWQGAGVVQRDPRGGDARGDDAGAK